MAKFGRPTGCRLAATEKTSVNGNQLDPLRPSFQPDKVHRMVLKYPPFNACSGILNAARNAPPLKHGAKGEAVSIVQGALLDLGIKLPKTVAKLALPDGIFGMETVGAVVAFQARKDVGLKQDGVVGQNTIAALDAKMAGKAPPVVKPPAVRPPPMTAHYQLGTADPVLSHDLGSGKWKSKPATLSHKALKAAIIRILPDAYVVIGDDATKHMAHYLGNSGKALTIDLEDMIDDVPSAKERYEAEVSQAKTFVETLQPGSHQITSRQAQGGYNEKEENWNWFFAIGGYSSWGKGTATVAVNAGVRSYALDFQYKFFDRYNWDKGKEVTIFKIRITDEFMGEFHRQGIAQEYDCVGTISRRFSWSQGQHIPKQQLYDRGGGRG